MVLEPLDQERTDFGAMATGRAALRPVAAAVASSFAEVSAFEAAEMLPASGAALTLLAQVLGLGMLPAPRDVATVLAVLGDRYAPPVPFATGRDSEPEAEAKLFEQTLAKVAAAPATQALRLHDLYANPFVTTLLLWTLPNLADFEPEAAHRNCSVPAR